MLDDAQGRFVQLASQASRAATGSRRRRGFSLIELMIAISIFAILMMLAMPSFTDFLGNTQIRTASESIMTGIRQAQSAAVKRNAPVSFVLDPAAGWQVVSLDPETYADEAPVIQSYAFAEGAPHAHVDAGGATRVTFNGFGRMQNYGGITPINQIDVTNQGMSSPHPLRVVVNQFSTVPGQPGIKMCDPAFALPDPLACPL